MSQAALCITRYGYTLENYNKYVGFFFTGQFSIPVVIGVSVVVITFFVAALTVALCCFFCACCPVRKRQRLRLQSSAFVVNGSKTRTKISRI